MDKTKLFWENVGDRERLIEALKQDKIAISSTDTVLGFLANCTQQSYEKILTLKETTLRRPFLVLIASVEKLPNFVDTTTLSENIIKLLMQCWPGPITFVFNAGKKALLYYGDKTVAIRCPDHAGLQKILPEFSGLFSTSANKSHYPTPEKFSDISPELLQKVDLVILDEATINEAKTKPSTLVDLTKSDGDFPFKVVREGAFWEKDLKGLYDAIVGKPSQ